MKGVYLRIHLFLFCFLFSVSVLYAQNQQVYDSGTIIVTGTAEPVTIEAYGGSVTVITADEIAEKKPVSVKELLSSVPGLEVTSTGINDVSVGIRGAAASHTLFMVDGIPFSDPSGMGGFDLWMIAPSMIERIEIVSGPVSAMYGSGAMAGVINIITKQEASGGSAGIYGGSEGAYGVNAVYAMKYLQIGGSFQNEDGISVSTDDDENDRYWTGSFYANHKFTAGNYSHKLTGMYTRSMYEYDNAYWTGEPYVYQTVYQVAFSPSYEVNSYWTPSLTTAYTKSTRDTYDSPYSQYNGSVMMIELNNKVSLGSRAVLNAGGKWSEEKGDVYDGITYAFMEDQKATTYEGFLNSTFKPLDGWNIFAGGRYSDISGEANDTSKFTFSVNTSYLIKPANLTLKAGYGTGFKAPSLDKLYNTTYGNINLKPEESRTWEVGFRHSVKDNMFVWEVTYFDSIYDDKISYNSYTSSFENTDRDASGVEVSAELYISMFAVNAAYTYADASESKAGTEQAVLRRPENRATLAVTAYPVDSLNLKLEGIYTDKSADYDWNMYADVTLDSYFLLNFYANYELKDFNIYGKVMNITDEDYTVAYGYKTKGINFLAGVNYRF